MAIKDFKVKNGIVANGAIQASSANILGNIQAENIDLSGTITTTGNIQAVTGLFSNITGTLDTAIQPNITTVGVLGNLSVSGNATVGTLLSQNIIGANITLAAISENGSINLTPSGNGVIDAGSKRVSNIAEPQVSSDAATKSYVDEVAQGLIIRPSVLLATTGNLSAIYDNGNLGVGATLTATDVGTFPQIDGVTADQIGQGILVKNQVNSAQRFCSLGINQMCLLRRA